MLNITVDKKANAIAFVLQGEFVGSKVDLETQWLNAAREHRHGLHVDLCKVEEIDDAGKALLRRMFSAGVEIIVGCHGPRTYSGLVSMADHAHEQPTAVMASMN